MYLSKFEHGEFARVSKIKWTHMFPFHQPYQTLHLFHPQSKDVIRVGKNRDMPTLHNILSLASIN